MADVYSFLVLGISGVLLVGSVAHGIAGALRGSSGSEVGLRMTRWAGWMLVAAVIFLVAESILMLLGDCSFADLDEIRWRPSLALDDHVTEENGRSRENTDEETESDAPRVGITIDQPTGQV